MSWLNYDFSSYSRYSQIDGNSQGTLDYKKLLMGDARNIVQDTYDILSSRCKTAYHENFMIKTTIDKKSSKVIGRGLTLNSLPDYKRLGISEKRGKEISDELEYRWNRWSDRNSFKDKQMQLYKGSLIAGDTLLLFDYRNKELVPRVVEGHIIDAVTDERKNLFNGVYTFLNGDPRALQLRYWDRDEEVKKVLYKYGSLSRRLNWILYFRKERPQQVRGLGLPYPILEISNNFIKFVIYEVKAAQGASSVIGWLKSSHSKAEDVFTTPNAEGYGYAAGVAPGSHVKRQVDLEPGLITTLEPDEEIQMADVKRPNSTVKEMFSTMMHVCAMAGNLPKEVVLQDFQSSYSASRAALLEANGTYEGDRSHIIFEVMNPTFKEFVKVEVMNGRLETIKNIKNSEELDLYTKCQWQGEAYRSIDPVKETKAFKEMIDLKLISRGEVSQLFTGKTYDIVVDEIRKSEEQIEKIMKTQEPPAPVMEAVPEEKK